MKALLVLILAAAVGYVAYEFAYPPIAEVMKFTKHVPKPEPKKEVLIVEAPKPKVEPKPEPKPEPKQEPKPEMKPEPKPEPPKVVMPAEPAPDPNGFVPPIFPPVEQLTQNWSIIPASYFSQPKQVTMKKDLEIAMKVGAGTSKASFKTGGKVFVMGQNGGNLIIGSAPSSPMRGEVAMDDTDFKLPPMNRSKLCAQNRLVKLTNISSLLLSVRRTPPPRGLKPAEETILSLKRIRMEPTPSSWLA
jgi:hypothetical protein